jgi:pSer/pThr/pTyr-binding forkhead associated (FHA) protein
MAKLVLHRPGGEMRDILLDQDRVTIGRRADHDVCLPFPAVSADHAEIITVGADSFLHDLGSTNGTFVNGERVTKHFLRDHDRIDLGREQLVYLTNDAEAIEPLPVEQTDANAGVVEPTKAAVASARAAAAARPSDTRVDARFANVDDLMTDLMQMNSDASAAVEISPRVAAAHAVAEPARNGRAESSGAVVEILSGPNAGHIASMHKPEFLFGKLGATVAAIRKEAGGYRLVAIDRRSTPLVNGHAVAAEGAVLAFGDTIDVGGVKLRFSREA